MKKDDEASPSIILAARYFGENAFNFLEPRYVFGSNFEYFCFLLFSIFFYFLSFLSFIHFLQGFWGAFLAF